MTQSTTPASNVWQRRLVVDFEADQRGQGFLVTVNDDRTFDLPGDMVYDRIMEIVQNAVRPLANDLSNHLKEQRNLTRRNK